MTSLDPEKLAKMSVPVETSALLGACMEARGRQEIWAARNPQVLEAMRERALVQGAESSVRMEGAGRVAPDRLLPVILGRAEPRDRPEEEAAGYRRAMEWALERGRDLPLAPSVLQHLHALVQSRPLGQAGAWKRRDTRSVEVFAGPDRKVKLVPTPAKDTPRTVKELCGSLHAALADGRIPPLLAIATFALDLLCIHPFSRGNGRVSRLAADLLLESHGFLAGRYVSLERLIGESRGEYYDAVAECSRRWHKGKNDVVPWWNYFLGLLHRAYGEVERALGAGGAPPSKSDLLRQAALSTGGPFALKDLAARVPAASPQLVKKVLSQLQAEGRLALDGRGRGAKWRVLPGM